MNYKKFAHIMRSIAVVSFIILALAMVSNCKKGVTQDDLIVLTMTQTQWGLNYASSMGHVEVFIQGVSTDGIILASLEMKGDNPSAAPLKPETADFVGGNKVLALFEKNRVLALLASPADGSIHIVIVTFRTEPSNESFEVTVQVTVSNYVDDGETSPLSLKIKPDEWNLNFYNRAGAVEAFIEGQGFDQIDISSIEMMGDNLSAAPLEAKSVDIKSDHIIVRFRKSQVIDLLLNPAPGSTHTIFVTYLFNGGTERMELSAVITIEEDDGIIDPWELKLEIRPDEWNLNFYNRAGAVEAFIEGQGFDQIDTSTIEMMGDNSSAAPLAAISINIKADHIIARFPKSQVLDLLLNPAEGTEHTIIVSFLEIGGTQRMELSAEISIEDDDDDDEEPQQPSNLKLELSPPDWNMNFYKETDIVTAKIRGKGLEYIDPGSLEMEGDNPSAKPLKGAQGVLEGDHVKTNFPKNKVLDLLLNPAEGTTHTVTVTFLVKGGGNQRMGVSTQVHVQ